MLKTGKLVGARVKRFGLRSGSGSRGSSHPMPKLIRRDHGREYCVLLTIYRYLATLSTGKTVLWCYLIWYLVTVFNHFDPSPAIWLNSLGISAVIGVALLLSVGTQGPRNVDRWQTFRLFLMPFCVSSFSSLIKGQGYILIFPAQRSEQAVSLGLCAAFVLCVATLKRVSREARA